MPGPPWVAARPLACFRQAADRSGAVSLFEYISVSIAIVLSFGVVRLLDGAPSAFAQGRRYWPHSLWLAIKFLHHFMIWWSVWGIRNANWDFMSFFAQLAPPVVLYLQASALVTSSADAITDWRTHFYGVRKRFFGLNIAFALAVPFSASLAMGRLPAGSPVLVSAAIIALSILGFRSASHRVQAGVVLIAAILNLVTIVTLMLAPPEFGPAD